MRALPLFALLLIAMPSLSMAADRDGDGVPDDLDNCLAVANASQVNSDHDRFGNACDGDVDQSGTTDAVDRKLLAAEVGARRPR
ncbi:MAG: thrombospondin type 3 repeat-containing protein, partial [Proteobacteria bacterium]|nr:thrombospondin type 3 repeat-containing protein [Pseudomonadota bacterium]